MERDIVLSNEVDRTRIWILPPLAPDIQNPEIDSSGITIDGAGILTAKGIAEPKTRILLQVNGSNFTDLATVEEDGSWIITGSFEGDIQEIVAFMIDNSGLLMAESRTVSPLVK